MGETTAYYDADRLAAILGRLEAASLGWHIEPDGKKRLGWDAWGKEVP